MSDLRPLAPSPQTPSSSASHALWSILALCALAALAALAIPGCGDEPKKSIEQVDTPGHIDDLCPSGLDPCTEEGLTECAGADGGEVRTCREVSAGCLGWGAPQDCPLNETCVDGACAVACPDAECDRPSARRCHPGSARAVDVCEDRDGDGCLEWAEAPACDAAEVCSLGACTSECVDECEGGAKRCDDGAAVSCADHDDDGCLEWGGALSCPGACALGQCVAECEDECGTAGLRRCDGPGVESCLPGADGCLHWGSPIPCAAGTTCSLGTCAAVCLDECVLGTTTCDAGGVVRCDQLDADACTDRALPEACGDGETCSAGACKSECEDECTSASALSCDAVGRAVRECRQGDDDPCLEWVVVSSCDVARGETCSNGVCGASCTDECDSGESRCAAGSGTRVERCGNADDDLCNEWIAGDDCAVSGQVCSDGRCAATCSDECAAPACDNGQVVPCGEFDADACRDRGTPSACAAGSVCEAGACVTTGAPPVKIAEVRYQVEGPDDDVFIELDGPPGTSLTGFSLVAINGADGVELARYAVQGALDSAGRWVLVHPDAAPAIADWGDAFSAFADLQNGPDNLLLKWGDTTADALGYGNFGANDRFLGEGEPAPGADGGASLARVEGTSGLQDTNVNRVDFAVAGVPTPGRANQASKRPAREGDLVVTELMIDPRVRSDSEGEWVELWNPTTDTWELEGCMLESDPDETHELRGSLVVAPGERVVLARSASPGFAPRYVYEGISFANSDDAIALTCGGEFIDLVTWGDAPSGASWSLDPAHADARSNDAYDAWCPTPLDVEDASTPGAANPPCVSGGTFEQTVLDSDYGSCDETYDWQYLAFEGAPTPAGDATLDFQWWAVLCTLVADRSTIEVEIGIGDGWTPIGDAAFTDGGDACSWLDESLTVDRDVVDQARADNGRIQVRFRIDGGCPTGIGCGFLGLTLPYNCGRAFSLVYDY